MKQRRGYKKITVNTVQYQYIISGDNLVLYCVSDEDGTGGARRVIYNVSQYLPADWQASSTFNGKMNTFGEKGTKVPVYYGRKEIAEIIRKGLRFE